MKTDNFAVWLSLELKKRDWSIRELGRRSRVSHNSVAKVMRGETEASWDFCAGIAPALGYSPVEILLIADKLRP
jgi:transcriptional regulator with XRE-family HTH domain